MTDPEAPTRPDPATLGPLALEIIDALAVLVPRGFTSVRVSLEADPPRAGELTTVLAPHIASPPPKPDVGVETEGMRAVLDEALGDLARAAVSVLPAGSALRALRAELDVPSLGHAQVHLLSDADEALYTVALPPAATRQLLFTEALYELASGAGTKAAVKQQALLKDFSGYDDWTYDQPARSLSLARGALPWRTYEAVALGSWARESESWLWGWANRQILPQCTSDVTRVRDELAVDPGLGAFRRPSLPCERRFAGALAQLAAEHMGALGVFSADYGPGELFLAVLARR